ncbi:MAG: hypothetical protein KDI01_10170 [Halioglobus sp.]|nr:hypothetical protein [Halioglobus sp.]
MHTPAIRETIAAAVRAERETGKLSLLLKHQLPRLHQKLVLPERAPVAALMQFITDYIESVPGCLSLVNAVSKRLGFYDYAAPFLHLAQDYFLQPPEILAHDGALESLLDEAFLAHRLLEEVNDHHIRHLHHPLLPLDMTEANIIVHHLLGDEFASQLEELIQSTAQQLLNREHAWDVARNMPGMTAVPDAVICSCQLVGSPPQIRLRLVSGAGETG